MKEEKNIVLNIILCFVTCGIWAIVWFVQLTDDAKEYSNDSGMQSGGLAFLLTLITCGIYGYYWAYKMGKMIQQGQTNNGMASSDNSILYLILQLFGLGFIGYCIMQSDLNAITRQKKSQMNYGQPQTPEVQA